MVPPPSLPPSPLSLPRFIALLLPPLPQLVLAISRRVGVSRVGERPHAVFAILLGVFRESMVVSLGWQTARVLAVLVGVCFVNAW